MNDPSAIASFAAFQVVFAVACLAGIVIGRRMERRARRKSNPSLVVVAESPLRIVAPLPGSRRWER